MPEATKALCMMIGRSTSTMGEHQHIPLEATSMRDQQKVQKAVVLKVPMALRTHILNRITRLTSETPESRNTRQRSHLVTNNLTKDTPLSETLSTVDSPPKVVQDHLYLPKETWMIA